MGANSGSASKSGPGAIFKSSINSNTNCSVKSHEGSSSSKSSNHQGVFEGKWSIFNLAINEKEFLLNSKIRDICIGIEPLGPGIFHAISQKNGLKLFLPAYIGGSTYSHHASCFLGFENDFSVKLEYGGYYGDEPNYSNRVYYWNKDGLRFAGMSWEEYKEIIDVSKSGSQIIILLTVKNKMLLKDLLILCCKEGNWRAKDYNLISNNCQTFIAKVIEILKVVRNDENPSRLMHNASLFMYPPAIVEALEKNEENKGIMALGQIPGIGIFADLIGGLSIRAKYNKLPE